MVLRDHHPRPPLDHGHQSASLVTSCAHACHRRCLLPPNRRHPRWGSHWSVHCDVLARAADAADVETLRVRNGSFGWLPRLVQHHGDAHEHGVAAWKTVPVRSWAVDAATMHRRPAMIESAPCVVSVGTSARECAADAGHTAPCMHMRCHGTRNSPRTRTVIAWPHPMHRRPTAFPHCANLLARHLRRLHRTT